MDPGHREAGPAQVLRPGCGCGWDQESLQLTWVWVNKQGSSKQAAGDKGSAIASRKIQALPFNVLLQLRSYFSEPVS